MAHYRSRRRGPAAAATQHRDPDGRLYYEELMGEEGFSSDSSLLYHRGVPSAIVASEVWELPEQTRTVPNHPLKPRHLQACTTLETGRRCCHRPAARPRQQRRADLVRRHRHRALGRTTATRSATSASSWSPGSRRGPDGVRGDRLPRRRLRDRARGRPRTAGCRPRRRGSTRSRPTATSPPPKRYLSRYGQLLEHAPYCERDLHGPAAPLLARGHRGGGAGQAPHERGHRRDRDDVRDPPVRRGGLGRLPLPVHAEHRRLHADHRQGAPAAAGAPGLRGAQLRGLQLPAAQGRLPPARRSRCRTTTPTSTATR